MAQSALPSARTSAREIRLGRFHMAETMRRTVGKEWDARALMIKASGGASESRPSPRIVLVQNWFEELKQRGPAK